MCYVRCNEHIEAFVQEPLERALAAGKYRFKPTVGKIRGDFGDEVPVGTWVAKADAQMRLACAQGACARLKAFCRAQDGACVFEQPFSFVCEKKSTADACKKPHAERFFKPSNRHAESGLRHEKPFSCRSERFAFGDRNKVAKLT